MHSIIQNLEVKIYGKVIQQYQLDATMIY